VAASPPNNKPLKSELLSQQPSKQVDSAPAGAKSSPKACTPSKLLLNGKNNNNNNNNSFKSPEKAHSLLHIANSNSNKKNSNANSGNTNKSNNLSVQIIST
jgi:hypothetical protein